MTTKLSAIMRDITNHSGGIGTFDSLVKKIEKAAKKGESFIIEKCEQDAMARYIPDYTYWLGKIEDNKESSMAPYYKNSFEEAKRKVPEEYIELINQGFKISMADYCIPFFGKPHYKMKISW
jgi:hypothetical protein